MAGAPSHLELFDNKPQLAKFDGTLPPAELLKGYRAAFINPNSKLLGPKFKFAKHGQCGAELSELLPHLAAVVDDIAIVKSMVTDAFNHAPGQILMSTGSQQFGKPSLGAWTLYGLGSESQNLPGFVVFSTGCERAQRRQLELGQRLFADHVSRRPLPHRAATRCLYLSNPRGVDHEAAARIARRRQRAQPAAPGRRRRSGDRHAHQLLRDGLPHAGRAAPEAIDISREPEHILKMYGAEPGKPSFAATCLLARRLVERGVRFVEIFHEAWDQHGNLATTSRRIACTPTRPAPRSITDLKQRGLLDDTLVVWGGEFGRTPMVQGERQATAATIIPTPSPCGSPAAASSRASHSAKATTSASMSPRTASTSTICTRRFCICSASTRCNSHSNSKVSTNA